MRRQIVLTIANVFFFLAFSGFSAIQAGQFLSENFTNLLPTELPATGNDSAKTAEATKAEASLVGRWENPYFVLESGANGQDTNGRSLKYQFRADRTYTRTLGGAETQIEENGTWEVSADGNSVLMRSRSVCDGQTSVHTALIKHLSMDELVLEQTMCVAGIIVASEPKEFYFNKF